MQRLDPARPDRLQPQHKVCSRRRRRVGCLAAAATAAAVHTGADLHLQSPVKRPAAAAAATTTTHHRSRKFINTTAVIGA